MSDKEDKPDAEGLEATENANSSSSSLTAVHNHAVDPEKPVVVPGCAGCGLNTNRQKEGTGEVRPDGKVVIDEDEYYHATGFAFSTAKKWTILSVIFAVQCSMNFNASVYGNVANPLIEKFGISVEYARAGQGAFLVSFHPPVHLSRNCS